ncbi:signal transducer and activator of transcription C-like [Cyprinodon tularosa]|uniref:signal transducer and activator of transcription C-like n=1 Tax=Cyprinodon tularosa TaxID=77115 RepID=UPI0018E259BC|nr:signal transducer and activator of transcription C-like [Cyprinodon tularosa]
METFYKDKLNEERSALQQNQEELMSFKERLAESIKQNQHLHEEISTLKKEGQRLQRQSVSRSRCQQCEQHQQEHKLRLAEMETFYKDKLNEERSALQQNQEELMSFKERLAESIKQNQRLHEEM